MIFENIIPILCVVAVLSKIYQEIQILNSKKKIPVRFLGLYVQFFLQRKSNFFFEIGNTDFKIIFHDGQGSAI